jgi:hypothetical protein
MSKWIVLSLLALLVPLAAHSGVFWAADGGFFEAQFDRNQKVPSERVFFVWDPHFLVTDVTYEIFILCNRSDASGEPFGKNKFKVTKIAIGPTDDEVLVKSMAGRVNDGFVVREVPDLAKYAGGPPVVGEVTISVKKKVKAGDIVLCRVDITESV